MSPQELLEYFISLAPTFKESWASEDNYNIRNDGSYNFHSVCAEFSNYFREQSLHKYSVKVDHEWVKTIPDEKLITLFKWVENNIKLVEVKDSTKTLNDDLSNALYSCFLENIAQTKAGEYAQNFMGLRTKVFFVQWHIYP